VECGSAEYNPNGQNANVWVFRDSGWPYTEANMGGGQDLDASAIAFTTLTFTEAGELVDADVEINSENVSIGLDVKEGAFDLRTIVTHEMGHFLGFDHTEVTDAMMAARFPTGIARHQLEPDDVDAVCSVYRDTRGPDSCAPKGGFSEQCGADQPDDESEPKAGCSVHSPGAGKQGARTIFFLLVLAIFATFRRFRFRSAQG
jgi:hypothetical protein